jgi:hypothetical protein
VKEVASRLNDGGEEGGEIPVEAGDEENAVEVQTA